MIFQSLDIENSCTGIFTESGLLIDPDCTPAQLGLTKTWKYSLSMNDKEYLFLSLYIKGQDLRLFSKNQESYDNYVRVMESQRRAARISKLQLDGTCFYDALPKKQITGWLKSRHECLKHISETVPRPSDYDILHKAHVLATTIRNQDIKFMKDLSKVDYNIFGTLTGRFSTNKNSLPILNLKKEQRSSILPTQGLFVELDFNAAEARTLIALQGEKQPKSDIHTWISEKVYDNKFSREECKVKLFSWLYNFSSSDTRLEKFFSRQIFRDFYSFENKTIHTPYNRLIPVEERKAQNYLLQSTTSDIVVENSYNILNFLKNRKSKIAFTMHDSVILDVHPSETSLLKQIKGIFENTKWGNFLSNCKVGKNFGEMRELLI